MARSGGYALAGAKRTVLVIEDNALNREILGAILEDYFDVLLAENGREGLEQLERHYQKISIILLDVYMPVMDGFEFLRHKRENERFDPIPVIVTTASETVDDEVNCLELGANDFVVKPYNVDIMMNRINNTIRLRESASLVNQLTWDKLTGLYSKEFFYRNVEDALSQRKKAQFDMVCSDIENFKSLNERYGAKACDRLLQNLASYLSETIPGFVLGGRLGGDTFAFLIEHQESGWEDMLYDVPMGVKVPSLNVKFGIVDNLDRSLDVRILCDHGIVAIEKVKGIHGVGIGFYDDEMRQRQLTEQILLESLETALREGQFTVRYQPKHDVHTGKTGGAEALARWDHPELGRINPGMFIPMLERNGLISKLDFFIWEECCKEIRRCLDAGLPVVPISVNASALDFDIPDLAQRISDLADSYGVDHSLLHMELTETAYSDNPASVRETLDELRAHGFLAELDDFGSGYSSLASLNALPLDVMKLDMSMIRQAVDLGDFRIVQSTIQLAQTLGLKTVVEGVETEEGASRLKELGCDLIQGYFYSQPLESEEFEAYLARS